MTSPRSHPQAPCRVRAFYQGGGNQISLSRVAKTYKYGPQLSKADLLRSNEKTLVAPSHKPASQSADDRRWGTMPGNVDGKEELVSSTHCDLSGSHHEKNGSKSDDGDRDSDEEKTGSGDDESCKNNGGHRGRNDDTASGGNDDGDVGKSAVELAGERSEGIKRLSACRSVENAEGEDRHNCAICSADLLKGDVMCRLFKCRHSFHKECLRSWLRKGTPTCPSCQTRIIDNAQPSPLAALLGVQVFDRDISDDEE